MKKILVISIFACSVLLFIKYFISDYNIEYKINDYNIKTTYDNNRLYFEIENKNKKYNFDIYKDRKLSKDIIKSIKFIGDDSFNCIYPIIDDVSTYPLCYVGEEYIDYHLIDSSLLDEYKKQSVNVEKSNKDFVYYNNLSSDEYVALWNYKGYIVMNGKTYNYIDLFKKDRYDNTLAYLLGNTIYMANYNEEHEYTKLITLNLETQKSSTIELGYSIDYDSYIVGSIEKKLYIFDNKYSILYEINTKNNKVNIISNNEKGYVKYNGKDFITCSKSEYKIDKIKYISNNSLYQYTINNGVYKIINDNKNISQKISANNLNIIKEKNNALFYSYEDNFYLYSPYSGNSKIFYNYELSFNKDNTIFVYLNN